MVFQNDTTTRHDKGTDMDSLDKQIKDYLAREKAVFKPANRFQDASSAEEIARFINDELEGEALSRMLRQLKEDPEMQKLVREARLLTARVHEADKTLVPTDWERQAKGIFSNKANVSCPHCGKAITPFKKPVGRQNLTNFLWLAASAASFITSFFYHHYFYQCLALALFFGIKWVLDRRSTKTQILIYKALKDEESPKHSRDLPSSCDTIKHHA